MITKEQVLENLEEVKKYIAEAETKKEEKPTTRLPCGIRICHRRIDYQVTNKII